MSMISHQIEQLKDLRFRMGTSDKHNPTDWTLINGAIDTIEALSEKLSTANMERSERYYSGGWIACKDRLPKENEVVILTFQNSAGIHVGEATYKNNLFFYVTDTEFGYYEEVYKNPIAWQPLPQPYKPDKEDRS